MKQGWKYKPFGEVFTIKMGKTPPRGDKSCWDTKKESENKWVSISDISQNEGKVIFDTKEYITDAATEKIFRVKANSLLMSFKLTIGKMAFAGTDLYTNEAIIAIPENKEYNLKFLYFYLSSYNWSSLTDGNEKIKGKTLNKESIGRIKLPIIPLSDQQRIVSYLDAEFAKIEALKANAEKQLQAAKDLFQAALKELLTPKDGWMEKKLVEVCKEIFSGGDAPKENMSKEPTIDFGIPIYANAAEFDGLYGYTNYYRVNEPSVTIAARGSGTGLVIKRKGAYLPIVRLIVVIPNTFISVDYLYFALQTIRIKSNGTAIPQLTVPVVKQYRICYPPNITEQQRIADRLDALSANLKALQTNYTETITLCNDLKQALLKKVFG